MGKEQTAVCTLTPVTPQGILATTLESPSLSRGPSLVDMARYTLENGQKVAGQYDVLCVSCVLRVLVTRKMNFLCIFSIFCDFESKVPKLIYTRKMPKKVWSLGFFGCFGCFGHFLLLFFPCLLFSLKKILVLW